MTMTMTILRKWLHGSYLSCDHCQCLTDSRSMHGRHRSLTRTWMNNEYYVNISTPLTEDQIWNWHHGCSSKSQHLRGSCSNFAMCVLSNFPDVPVTDAQTTFTTVRHDDRSYMLKAFLHFCLCWLDSWDSLATGAYINSTLEFAVW